jgi:non-ribosomal peptide synthetase component E (peptide arylation enzyme)
MKSGESTDLDDICSFLKRKNISKHKWPERLIMVDEMPLTPTRKVIKSRLVEQL